MLKNNVSCSLFCTPPPEILEINEDYIAACWSAVKNAISTFTEILQKS